MMRLKEGPPHPFQPPIAVLSSLGSHVYTFTNGADNGSSEEEAEYDVMELRARREELRRQTATRERVGDVVLLEHIITEDDNLNKLALQYGCKVADIKRVNNFIREQDIYALKTIKVPVKAHGLLTEGRDALRPQQGAAQNSRGIESPESSPENRHLSHYFKEIDKNIEAAVQTQDLFSEDFCPDSPSQPASRSPGQKEPSLGAVWGIRWWNAVFIMLLIGIVLPVFYIIYFKTQDISGAAASRNESRITVTPTSKHFALTTPPSKRQI